MKQRKRQNVRAAPKKEILRYSGLLVCGDCGRSLTGKRIKLKSSEYVSYVCSTYHRYGKEYCTSHTLREEYLDDIIRQELLNTRNQYRHLWQSMEASIAKWLPNEADTVSQIRKQEMQIQLLEEETEAILMERIRDKANVERYDRMIRKREEQIAQVKKRIEELENIGQVIRSRQAKLKKDISLMDDILAEEKISEAHLRMLIEKIVIHETMEGISLDIQVKAPFQNHTDTYENGVLTVAEIKDIIKGA